MINSVKDEHLLSILLEYKKQFNAESNQATNTVAPVTFFDEMNTEQKDMVEYIINELSGVTREQAVEAVNQIGSDAYDIGLYTVVEVKIIEHRKHYFRPLSHQHYFHDFEDRLNIYIDIESNIVADCPTVLVFSIITIEQVERWLANCEALRVKRENDMESFNQVLTGIVSGSMK